MNGFSLPSLFTVVLAVVFGVITALQQVSNIQALKLGPLSYTSVIGSLSTMIPTLCGAIIWGETIAVIQWVGILLMVGCFLLSVSSDAEQKKTSARWLNKWNLYLSGVMDSAVFFPVVNGGGLILTTLSAVVLFRERLRVKQWVGMLIGTAAVICLCNPFA